MSAVRMSKNRIMGDTEHVKHHIWLVVLSVLLTISLSQPVKARVVGVMFDDSRSLAPTFNTTLYAAKLLISLLPPDDRAFAVRVSNPSRVEALPVDTVKARQESLALLEDWQAKGLKTPVGALTKLLREVARETRPGEEASLILLTDGEFDPDPPPAVMDELQTLRDGFRGRILRVFFVSINPANAPRSGKYKGVTFREIIQRQGIARKLTELFGRPGAFDDTIEVQSSSALYRQLTDIVGELLGADPTVRNDREMAVAGNSIRLTLPFPVDGLGIVLPDAPRGAAPNLVAVETADKAKFDKGRADSLTVAMARPDNSDWPQLASTIARYFPTNPLPAGDVRLIFDRPIGGRATPILHSRITPRWTLGVNDVQWSDNDGMLGAMVAAAGQKAVLRVVLADDARQGAPVAPSSLRERPTVILRSRGQPDRELTRDEASGAFVTTLDFPVRPETEQYPQNFQIILRFPGYYQSNGAPLRVEVKPPVALGVSAGPPAGDSAPCENCQPDVIPLVYRSGAAEPARLVVPVVLTPSDYVGPVVWRLAEEPPKGMSIRLLADGLPPLLLDHRNGVTARVQRPGADQFKLEISVAGPDLTRDLVVPKVVASIPAADKPVTVAPLGGLSIKILVPPLVVMRADNSSISPAEPLTLPPRAPGGAPEDKTTREIVIHGLLDGERLSDGQAVITLRVPWFPLPVARFQLEPTGDNRAVPVDKGEWWLLSWVRVVAALLPADWIDGKLTFASNTNGRSARANLSVTLQAPGWLAVAWGLVTFVTNIWIVLVGLTSTAFAWVSAPALRFPKTALLRVEYDRFGVRVESRPLRQPWWKGIWKILLRPQDLLRPQPERYGDQYVVIEAASGGFRLLRQSNYRQRLRFDQSRETVESLFRQDPAKDYIELSWGTVLRDDEQNITLVFSG